jgi:hypothetical protein
MAGEKRKISCPIYSCVLTRLFNLPIGVRWCHYAENTHRRPNVTCSEAFEHAFSCKISILVAGEMLVGSRRVRGERAAEP